MRSILRLFTALALALVGCASTNAPAPAPREVEPAYRVGAPDELLVLVLPEPQIARQTLVRPDGMISVDLIGDVRAAGRTVEEISAEIAKRIAPFIRNPQVTVSVVISKSRAVTILGEVVRPSSFPLDKEVRVAEALGRVNGPTYLAARSRIKVVRDAPGASRVYKVNLDAIEDGDLRTNLVLEGGDVVVVPPTVSASIGNAIRGFFYPVTAILGIGGPATRAVLY
jgi:polysaccharide export outer membrane protein